MTNYKPLLMKLGTAEDGSDYKLDLTETNGLLIGGRTGSGKTVLMFDIIHELAKNNSPRNCEITIVDLMGVDYGYWKGLPHFRRSISKMNPRGAFNYLIWHCNEILERYSFLTLQKLDSIEQFNEKSTNKMPYCVLVIDEYCDMMNICAQSPIGHEWFHRCIETMTTLGPAVGVYLVMGTQRIEPDIITKKISKAFDTHMAFQTREKAESDLLIGLPGAEELGSMGEVIVHQIGQRLDKFKVDYLPDDKIEEFVNQLNQGKGGIDAETERAASEPSDAEN